MPNLEQIAEQFNKREAALKRRIIICGGTGCIANGSMKVRDALVEELKKDTYTSLDALNTATKKS